MNATRFCQAFFFCSDFVRKEKREIIFSKKRFELVSAQENTHKKTKTTSIYSRNTITKFMSDKIGLGFGIYNIYVFIPKKISKKLGF